MPWNPATPGSTSQADNQPSSSAATNAVASAARTTTGNSTALYLGQANTLSLLLDVTAASGTTPNLVLSVEWSHDGSTFFSGDPVDVFTAVTAAAKKVKSFTAKAPYFRVVWTITGTTPSFTFAVHAVRN